jgi:pilus assembly protein CpaB
MNPVRIAILAVAAIAAIGVAVLLRNLTMPHAAAPAAVAQAVQPSTRVLVASHDLAVGQRLSESDMTWQPWPADSLNPSYITDGSQASRPAETRVGALVKASTTTAKDLATGGGPAMQVLKGAVVRDAMVKGEPLVKGKVVVAGDGGYMSVRLGPGMRALAVPVSAETGAGGFIQPGDKIDLIESHPDTGGKGGSGFVTQTVVSNARVLAVDQTTGQAKNGQSIIGATITLEVPAIIVPMVAEARARGGLMLALRSYADTGGGPGLGGDTAGGGGVRLIRGGEVSQAMVPQ